MHLQAIVLTSLSCPFPGLRFEQFKWGQENGNLVIGQVENLHSINVTRITAFLGYQPCPFPTVVTQVQFAHPAGFCFPDKSTEGLMTDQDTLVAVTLCCPLSCQLETGLLGMGLMADKS